MHIKKAPGSTDLGTPLIIQGTSPQHQAMIQSAFDLPKSITADFQVRYVSTLTAQKVPEYWTGDLSLGWGVTKHLRLAAVGQNLFQPYHVEFIGDPRGAVGIKRDYYGKITWTSE
jgi:iron complex outermembrane receptor protein